MAYKTSIPVLNLCSEGFGKVVCATKEEEDCSDWPAVLCVIVVVESGRGGCSTDALM